MRWADPLSLPAHRSSAWPQAFALVLSGCTSMLLSGCSFSSVKATPSAARDLDSVSYPTPDAGLGEHLYPEEKPIAAELSTLIEASIRKQYAAGSARRDAHPKAHGCVKAEISILDTLPPALSHGIFVPGSRYQAWIRFSNGSGDPNRPDRKGDARGMAIKVLGVPGKKLLEDESDATTQDFIMINHPVFFAADPARYRAFLQDGTSGQFLHELRIPFDLGARGTLIALQTRRSTISNPLQARYWSMVPYQLGTGADRQAVKYSARACSNAADAMPSHAAPDFLRAALRSTLQQGDACMEFLVQPRTSEQMDVEDSRIEWPEDKAPFYKVATIRIPRQDFDTPAQNAFCENLSFTPWHALPAHKPLGATNRLRKVIYDHISRVRHEMNETRREEP